MSVTQISGPGFSVMAQQPEFMTVWMIALRAHRWDYNPWFMEFDLPGFLGRGQIPLSDLARQPLNRALEERAERVLEQ